MTEREPLDGLLAQAELLHLAGDGHREPVDDEDVAGHLEVRDLPRQNSRTASAAFADELLYLARSRERELLRPVGVEAQANKRCTRGPAINHGGGPAVPDCAARVAHVQQAGPTPGPAIVDVVRIETEECMRAQDLTGKGAIVTGGSRGIGRAIALGLAARGASVVVGYVRNHELAEEVVVTIRAGGGNAVAVQGDLADHAQVSAMFDRAEHEIGPLDIVYANAAVAGGRPLVECTPADYEQFFATHVKSVFFTLQEAARRVRDGGRIVAMSSAGTRLWSAETSLYLGAKGAVEQFVRVLAVELGPRNVTVNALSPGFTDTDMLPDEDRALAPGLSPLGRIGAPDDVADVAVFLASDEARWVTGQNLAAAGGVV